MDLMMRNDSDSTVNGYYSYAQHGIPIELHGNVSSGHLKLMESDGEKTYAFEGDVEHGVYKGIWIGRKQYGFLLSESYAQSADHALLSKYELLPYAETSEDDDGYSNSGRDVVYNSRKFIVVCEYDDEILKDAAHPNSMHTYYTFDLNSGKRLKLSNVLASRCFGKLKGMIRKKFTSHDYDGLNLDVDAFFNDGNYFITSGGITFCYDAEHVFGQLKVFFSFKEIRDCLDPDFLRRIDS